MTKNTKTKIVISSNITSGGSDVKKSDASGDAYTNISNKIQLVGPYKEL
eukprot:CAMPEP_0198461780 /NCGR_PEP_ID=MMETSP1456-20131121/446_1 /TAXON_ID=1461544 ORGANISM="Unidentified sp., Strain RCC1871" /NCGR_SAMPLE_ID=MMETSP1456 /ASSEMBLY_ACC=CAM_ASM_001119 /LENGTH=48 /DNA_ID= /DNA_START= /DNA_END= /DNA_ORIENTATION=